MAGTTIRRSTDRSQAFLAERTRYDPLSGTISNAEGRVYRSFRTAVNGKRYGKIAMDGVQMPAHRVAWILANGAIPEGMQIDHVDGNGMNNRLANLRLVTHTDNHRNRRRPVTNKTGVIGVKMNGGKFRAVGEVDGKSIHIGNYGTLAEAAAARHSWQTGRGFHPNHGADRPL